MAECHPVGFRWVMAAKARGATIIHVDPRFSRTSAVADIHVPIRAGSDIAFLGGLITYVIEHERYFKDYVVNYTNAGAMIRKEFRDTEDLDGLFSGWNAEEGRYDLASWHYQDGEPVPAVRRHGPDGRIHGESWADGPTQARARHYDPTLQDPRCVFQILRRHFSRYTPELVERTCGIPPSLFFKVAETLCDNSGPERTSAFCYAVGWTQHTVGVQ